MVNPLNVLLSPCQIKLGFMKQFAKALDKEGSRCKYLCRTFPALSPKKLRVGIFDGQQIRQLMKDDKFVRNMTVLEEKTWLSFLIVVEVFGKLLSSQ